MTNLTHTSFYNVTCKICTVIRDALAKGFVEMVRFAEAIGTAQAAHRLTAAGYHEEARALMTGVKKDD